MKTWVAVLSILGGLFGLGSGFLVTAFGAGFGEEEMASSGAAVFWLSALAIILGFTSWKWHKISGFSLIAISVVGLVMNGLFFTLSFIFLLIAGIMATRLGKNKKTSKEIAA
jgi:hypothetical protein